MRRRPPTALSLSLAALGLSLVACGGDEPGSPKPPVAGSPPPVREAPPREELESLAAKARASAGVPNPAAERAAKELTDAFKQRLGPTLEEDGKKAKAFAARPLTANDVETYLALAPRMREAANLQGAAAAVLSEKGLSGMEWGVLSGRIRALRMALGVPAASLDPKTAADVAVLRPFADRLAADR